MRLIVAPWLQIPAPKRNASVGSVKMDAVSAALKALPALGALATGNLLLALLIVGLVVLWYLPDWLWKWKRLLSDP